MEFVVRIGYNFFKFINKNDAVMFAEIAKAHSTEKDITVQVQIEWVKEPVKDIMEDPEDEEELREDQ